MGQVLRQTQAEVARVAAEHLVAAVAGEGDGDVLAGEAAEPMAEQRGPRAEGLVEAADQGLEVAEEVDVELELAVPGAEELADAAGDRTLLIRRPSGP
jgi:hypothetical protein